MKRLSRITNASHRKNRNARRLLPFYRNDMILRMELACRTALRAMKRRTKRETKHIRAEIIRRTLDGE